MGKEKKSASAEAVRRLAVTKQHLVGPVPRRAAGEDIHSVTRDLAHVHWDPVNIVAPSHIRTGRGSDGFAPGSDVFEMILHLHMSGQVMVVGHSGNQDVWGLSEEFLPRCVERSPLSEEELERQAAQRALRALGTATFREISYYFVRGWYQRIEDTLVRLEEESRILRVIVVEFGRRDVRYIHASDVPLLESITDGAWEPRMSLLPPFDKMLAGRDRLTKLFGFDYVREQFLPQERRRYGTYVLPIVWGSSFVGRFDPAMDRKSGKLIINSVHAEPGVPQDKRVALGIRGTIERLASFLGAEGVVFTSHVPAAWRSLLQ